jgi:hypothetical protein
MTGLALTSTLKHTKMLSRLLLTDRKDITSFGTLFELARSTKH